MFMADVFQAQWNWYKFPNLNFIAAAVNFYLLYLSGTDTRKGTETIRNVWHDVCWDIQILPFWEKVGLLKILNAH